VANYYCYHDTLALHIQIVVQSLKGGEAPLDPGSIQVLKDGVRLQNFFRTKEVLWKIIEKLSRFLGQAKEFEAIFFVGGHGR